VLPSDFDSDDLDYVPQALATLEGQAGVTIIERTLIYYSDIRFNRTFNGVENSYWQPISYTCGCYGEPDCTFRSCGGTIPINVEYEQCTPWQEVRMIYARRRIFKSSTAAGVLPCYRVFSHPTRLFHV